MVSLPSPSSRSVGAREEAAGRERALRRLESNPRLPASPSATARATAAGPDGSQRPPLVTRTFLLLWLTLFLEALAFHCTVHLPGFFHGLGAGEGLIGWLALAFALASLTAQPLVGWLVDWRGRRPLILAVAVLHLAVAALHLTLASLGPWAFAVRALHGICEAMLFSALTAFASDIIPSSRRTEGLALFGVAGLVPIGLAGLVGDVVLHFGSYRELFLVQTGLALVALVAALQLREPPRQGPAPTARGALTGYFRLLRQRELLPVWFVGVVFSTSLTTVFGFLKVFFIERGVGSMSAFMGGYIAVAISIRIFLGWVPERLGATKTLVPALFVLGAGLWILSASDTSLEVVLAGACCGFGHGFAYPTGLSLAVTRASAAQRGAAVAIFASVFPLGLLFAPLFGALIERFGYAHMFELNALTAVVGVLLFALWDRAVRGAPLGAPSARSAPPR